MRSARQLSVMCLRRIGLIGALFIVGFAASVLGVLLLISAAAGVHWTWGIACALINVSFS